MDIKTAFLNGDLEEEIYIEQLEGYVVHGQEHKVCKLVKSLYGLKQAPKQWHEKFDNMMLTHGYVINGADKCIYNKFNNVSLFVYILMSCLYLELAIMLCTIRNVFLPINLI